VETKEYTFERLRVADLTLDMRNPRIAKWVEMYGEEISGEQMALALGAGGALTCEVQHGRS